MRNNYFFLTFLIASVGLSVVFGSLVYKYIPIAFFGLIQTCQGMFNSIYQTTDLSLWLLAIVGVWLGWKTYWFLLAQYQLQQITKEQVNFRKPYWLVALIKTMRLENKIRFVNSTKPVAFCTGILKPKIYLSAAMVELLSPHELEAVIRHEHYHVKKHDPLTQTLGAWFSTFSPLFPFINDFVSRYSLSRELQADAHAIQEMGTETHLLRALKKMLEFDIVPQRGFVARFSDPETLSLRITKLVSGSEIRYPRFNILNVALSGVAALVLVFLCILPVKAVALEENNQHSIWVCGKVQCNNICNGTAVTAESLNVNATYPFSPVFLNNQSTAQ